MDSRSLLLVVLVSTPAAAGPAPAQGSGDPDPVARCCAAAQILPAPDSLGCDGVCIDPNYSTACSDLTQVETQFVIPGDCFPATSGTCSQTSATAQLDVFRCRRTDQCTMLTYTCQWVKQPGVTQNVTYVDCAGDPCFGV